MLNLYRINVTNTGVRGHNACKLKIILDEIVLDKLLAKLDSK